MDPTSSGREIFKVLPIVMSAIAVLVSVASAAFTAYNQYYKRPRLRLVVSDKFRVWLGPKGELVVVCGVTAVNAGASSGVITRLTAELQTPAVPRNLLLQWRMFVEHKNVGVQGVKFDPHGVFAGWTDYLVVPARQAVAHQIQFFSDEPWVPAPGNYTLRFRGYAGDQVALGAETRIRLNIDATFAARLSECRVDPETRIVKKSMLLSRVYTS